MEPTTREGDSPFLLSTAGDSDAAKMSRGEAQAERRSTTVEKDKEKREIIDSKKIIMPRKE